MMDVSTLANDFHMLNGNTISQSKKRLNVYLTKIKSQFTSEENIVKFFNLIETTNETEKHFKLEIAIVLRRNDYIYDALKSGNVTLMKRILKSYTFQNIFKKTNSRQFVNDLLPCLSYNFKLKLFNRLYRYLNNEQLLEEYFIDVEKIYGISLAQAILPGCSSEFIIAKTKVYKCSFTESQLYYIVQKKPEFLKEYFKLIKENSKLASSYPKIMQYLSKTNVKLFWTLQEEFKLNFKLGRRTTERVLENHVEKILIGEKHMKILNYYKVYEILKRNNIFKEFVMTFLPEKREYFYTCLKMDNPLMKFLQKFFQNPEILEIIKSSFEDKYSMNFYEGISYLDDDFVKIILVADRERIIKYVFERDLIHLQTSDKAIPVLKDRLSLMKRKDFPNIIQQIFENCALNNDKATLLENMEFIFRKFRYDEMIVKQTLEKLSDWYYFDHFNTNMWIYIDNYFETYLQYFMDKHLPFYFAHLVDNNIPLESYFRALISSLHMTEIEGNPFYKKKYENIALEAFGTVLDPLSESNLYGYMCLKYIEWALDFNKRNFRNKALNIAKYPNIIKFFCASLYDEATKVLYKCLKQFEYEHFDTAFWKNYNLRANENILIWYAQYHPEKLIENMEIIFTNIDYKVETFLKYLYKHRLQQICDELKKYAFNVLKEMKYEQSCFAVLYLSIFSESEFYNIAESLIPSSDGKVHADTLYEKFTLQRVIIRSLKNTTNCKRNLSTFKKYFRGYYIKNCLDTFSNICAKSPEVELESFLKEIEDQTTKTHIQYACKVFLPVSKSTNLDQIWQFESNKQTDKFLLNLEKISKENILQYLQDLSTKETWKDIVEDLIEHLTDENIKRLDIEILKYLIEETLFKFGDIGFHSKCIFTVVGENRSKLLRFTLDLFKHYVNKNRDKFERLCSFHDTASTFIISFCKYSFRSKENKDIVLEFFMKFATIFDPEEFISAYLILEFTNLFFESDFNAKEFGKKTSKMLLHYVQKYDASFVSSFAFWLKVFLGLNGFTSNNTVELINSMFEEDFNPNAALVAIRIINVHPEKENDYDDEAEKVDNNGNDDEDEKINKDNEEEECNTSNYNNIINILKNCEDPTVRYHLLRQETSTFV